MGLGAGHMGDLDADRGQDYVTSAMGNRLLRFSFISAFSLACAPATPPAEPAPPSAPAPISTPPDAVAQPPGAAGGSGVDVPSPAQEKMCGGIAGIACPAKQY